MAGVLAKPLLAAAVGVSATRRPLIPLIRRLTLTATEKGAAGRATVPLTAITADAEGERCVAIRIGTHLQPLRRRAVRISVGHRGIIPSSGALVKPTEPSQELDDRIDLPPPAAMILSSSGEMSRKLRSLLIGNKLHVGEHQKT